MPKTCVFCGAPVPGKGEHVLPTWLLRRSDGQGPFTIEIDRQPVPKHNGKTERQQLARVLLPVCGGDSPSDCNGWLNDTFEQPAKRHVNDILDSLQVITGQNVDAVAQWAVKTLLLSNHPKAVNTELRKRPRRSWVFPDGMLPAMRSTGKIPDDLSLWAAVVNPDAPPVALPSFETTVLPRVTWENGAGGTGSSTMLGFATSDPIGTTIAFQLAFHPLTDIEHPLEEVGLVTRLWPNPPARLDFQTLPALDQAAKDRMGRVFASGGERINLPVGERWSRSTMQGYFSAQ
ncbi:hypothetical protein [Streptomyces fulvoviolaceus]|uniref:hypothetical protein n=1 Tax=Streptomyces fulvoviolaceus TaxID=285535 RepID=UPI0021C0FCAE|nr:hypothetical protein [Streptomyces fulvoviolaceus]MCT9079337.1 hypothetical protein [Streptomyces fulvoviolaceus]